MTPDDDAIKGLLGKAFGPEPPLTLDRAEIFRRGRRGVRFRRLTASGGVAAAVVAVVLGAAALNNLGGDGPSQDLSPGQSTSTEQPPSSVATSPEGAPAGPQLPLSTTTAPTDQRAVELTRVLAGAGVLHGLTVLPAEPNSTPLAFTFSAAAYRTSARLSDDRGSGVLIIVVGPAKQSGVAARCPDFQDCAEISEAGVAMAARTNKSSTGTFEYSISAVRSDGTNLTLISNNLASLRLDETRTTRPAPPVDLARLRAIATLPGLSYG